VFSFFFALSALSRKALYAEEKKDNATSDATKQEAPKKKKDIGC